MRDRSEQRGTCSGIGGGPWCAEPVSHEILEDVFSNQVCRWDS